MLLPLEGREPFGVHLALTVWLGNDKG